eukprot:Skav223310  [mRNA]  locus=scaffold4198:358188:359420:- [translate_table: standard]
MTADNQLWATEQTSVLSVAPGFSIKWPTERIEELYDYLRSLPDDVVSSMKSAVDRNACWFDYYSTEPGCDPFTAVTALLQRRVAQRPRFWGQFWGHGLPG